MIDNLNSVDVSIIIPCKNEVNNLKWTVDSLMNSKNQLKFEIIVVDDGSQDNSTGFLEKNLYKELYKDIVLIKVDNVGAAQARNIGADAANGRYLFFCDAHIKVPDGWLDDLVETMKLYDGDLVAPCIVDLYNPLAAGYGQTWNKQFIIKWLSRKPSEGAEIPIAGGAALGITKEAFEKINGFDRLFKVWGKEDEEICFKAWTYGYKIVINPYVQIKHLFRNSHPYEVVTSNVIYNMLCFAYSHFNEIRLKKTINITKQFNCYYDVNALIKENKELINKQREKYFSERVHDDDFIFRKFKIPY
ncbi:glycosyltransferase family 2 protein [Oceanirhabdus sp. W0125-5]|uniref:glycosyltransferase family 2 protein n=1 Tax=Oceanirhabdus sp. W0125-5 TaxID=2999116 RepID=UPI0022F2DBE1|nr:glycosyltransferase [Oceanirhabdus sp. W0125-5]WBW96635.1 glycosyltransferase [Oceanirhabdus sp. W0125-5]